MTAAATILVIGAGVVAHDERIAELLAGPLAPRLLGFAEKVSFLGPGPRALATIVAALFTLVGAAIVLGLQKRGEPENGPPTTLGRTGETRPKLSGFALAAGVFLAVSAALFVVLLLGPGRDTPVVLGVWLLMQVAAVAFAGFVDRREAGGPRFGLGRGELLALGALAAATLILVSHDFDSWVYAFLGDEWRVYERAEQAVRQVLPRDVFGPVEAGAYAVHAPFMSVVQGLVMRVWGIGNFGWRLSGALAFALTIPVFYVVARRFFGRVEAGIAVVLLSVSRALAADAHTGYGWGLPRLVTWAAFAALVQTAATYRLAWAAVLGLLCGWASLIGGTAAVVPPFVLLAALPAALSDRPKRNAPWLLVRPTRRRAVALLSVPAALFLLGAAIPRRVFTDQAALPRAPSLLWKTNLGPLWKHFFGSEGLGGPMHVAYTPREFAASTAENVVRTALAPLNFRADSHYVDGPLADPVTGALALLGTVLGLAMMARSPRSRELVGLFAPFAVVVGVLNPTFEYGDLRITRITDLVPFWILFGVLGLESLWRAWTSLGPAAARVFRVLTVALVALGVAWNLRATLVVMPAAGPTNLSVLALKTMQESPPTKQVWACLENWGPVGLFAPLYRQGARFHGLGTQEFLERAIRMDFGPDDRLLFAVSRRPRCPEKVFGWFRAFYPGLIVTALPREGDLPQVFSCDIPPALAAGAFTPAPGARRVSLRDLLYFTEPCTGEDDESFGTTPAGEPVRVAGSREADAWARGRDTVLLMPVSPGFTTFESFVVLGDVPDGSPEAAAVFRVELNGRPAGEEVRVMAGDAPVPLVVPLGGARILGLKSRWFAGPFERLLPVWLHPSLVRAGPGLDSDQTEAPR